MLLMVQQKKKSTQWNFAMTVLQSTWQSIWKIALNSKLKLMQIGSEKVAGMNVDSVRLKSFEQERAESWSIICKETTHASRLGLHQIQNRWRWFWHCMTATLLIKASKPIICREVLNWWEFQLAGHCTNPTTKNLIVQLFFFWMEIVQSTSTRLRLV